MWAWTGHEIYAVTACSHITPTMLPKRPYGSTERKLKNRRQISKTEPQAIAQFQQKNTQLWQNVATDMNCCSLAQSARHSRHWDCKRKEYQYDETYDAKSDITNYVRAKISFKLFSIKLSSHHGRGETDSHLSLEWKQIVFITKTFGGNHRLSLSSDSASGSLTISALHENNLLLYQQPQRCHKWTVTVLIGTSL